jgi:hypothetical protein
MALTQINPALFAGATNTTAVIQSNGTTAITVDASQRVAFVAGTAALPAITTAGDTNTGIFFPAADTIAFSEGGTESMRIDSDGFLLVGVTSPSGGHNTITSAGSNWALVAKPRDTSGSVYGFKSLLSYAPNNTSSYFIGCEDTSAGRMYVYSNGNIVNTNNSYGSLSDRTLKENIVDASPKLENLCKVKIRNFNLIGETTKQLGVVAQELEEVFPSMVEIDGKTEKKQVKYSVFVPMLVKAIQELKAELDTVKAELVALRNK